MTEIDRDHRWAWAYGLVPGLERTLTDGEDLGLVQENLLRRAIRAVRPELQAEPLDLFESTDELFEHLHLGEPQTLITGMEDTYLAFLRPLRPNDYGQLYDWFVRAGIDRPGHFRGRTPNPDEFPLLLWAEVAAQFAVCSRTTQELLGVVSLSDAHPESGVCTINAHRSSPSMPGNRGSVLDGWIQLVDHAFGNMRVRKLYLEVPGWAERSVAGLASDLLVREGRYEEYDHFGGQLWDRSIYALYVEKWFEWRSRWVPHGDLGGSTNESAASFV